MLDGSPVGLAKARLRVGPLARLKEAAQRIDRFTLAAGSAASELDGIPERLMQLADELREARDSILAAVPPVRKAIPVAPAASAEPPRERAQDPARRAGKAHRSAPAVQDQKVRVQYTPAGERPRLHTLRLVPYPVGANVTDAVSLRTDVGRQLARLSNGDTLQGALFGQRKGEILVLSVD
jgi:hypothetical protein